MPDRPSVKSPGSDTLAISGQLSLTCQDSYLVAVFGQIHPGLRADKITADNHDVFAQGPVAVNKDGRQDIVPFAPECSE